MGTMSGLSQGGEKPTILARYTEHLSMSVLQRWHIPVPNHDKEIKRVIEILGSKDHRNRYNPILVGEATPIRLAIVAEVVRYIVSTVATEDNPTCDVLSLNLEAIAADASALQAQRRLIHVLSILRGTAGRIILFVDDIPRLLGSTPGRYPVDAGPWLKPTLARGELQLLGTASLVSYQRYIEADPALQRRMSPVLIGHTDPD